MIRNLGRKLSVVCALAACLLGVLLARAQSPSLPTAAASGPSEASPIYDLAKEISMGRAPSPAARRSVL